MFASRVTKDVEVGDDIVTIKKLSYSQLKKAREARSAEQVQSVRDYGAEIMKAFRGEAMGEAARQFEEARASKAKKTGRYDEYDVTTTLRLGVRSWTCKAEDGTVLGVTDERIADLAEEVATKLFHAIVDLSAPPVEEVQAQEKNG